MKNKKLFAILTLVCFMFTLMPMAAFADTTNYAAVVEDYEVIAVGGKTQIEVTNAGNYYVFATDSTGDVYKKLGADNGKTNAIDVYTTTLVGTKNIIELVFSTPGSYTITVVEEGAAGSRLANIYARYTNGEIDKEQAAGDLTDEATVVMLENAVAVQGATAQYSIVLVDTPETITLDANSAFDTEKVYVKLLANGVKPMPGQTLTISTNSSAVDTDKAEVKTNAAGIASFEVSASTAGKFKVYVEYGTKADKTINVNAGALDPATIKTVAQPQAPVALGSDIAKSGVSFVVTDANGNAITDALLGTSVAKVAVTEKPAGSALKGAAFNGLAYNADNAIYVFATAATFDKEGDYAFKIALNNGAYATAKVTVKEFQEPVALKLVYKQNAVELDGEAVLDKVQFVDVNGVTKSANIGVDVELSATGYAIDTFDEATGKVVVKDNEKYVGSKINVIAVSEKYNLVANAELTVANEAAVVKYATTNADVAVNNTLVANVVDVDGNKVALNTTASSYDIRYIVLDKPADAKVAISTAATNDLVTKGQFKVSFTASKAGEYEVQTVVRYDQGNGVVKYYSGIETITVGAGTFQDVVVVSIGADKMVVNDELVKLDVAPYIENNRTMMQYNVLGAFGFDVQWDGANNAVIAEGDGIKVVMTIGSKVAVVNGTEVALDVAPTIVNGRTIVPVGFLTGTFGINPAFTYNADGSIADILFTK